MQPNPKRKLVTRPVQPVADLCTTCIHCDSCHLRATTIQPVHECNEFDDGTPAISNGMAKGLLHSVPKAPKQNSAPAREALVGLCMNCDHRDTCTLPRPSGGVWHCEEYK
jgi:hypothetical protein